MSRHLVQERLFDARIQKTLTGKSPIGYRRSDTDFSANAAIVIWLTGKVKLKSRRGKALCSV